jgi:hypothetical protein
MWRPRHDEGDKFLIEERRITSRDEYRLLLCYGTYHSTIDRELKVLWTRFIRKPIPTDALDLFDATRRTRKARCNAHEEKHTHLRRLKRKKMLMGDERVAEGPVNS